MIRIMHISDTHILTNKRHDEYRKVFEQIYDLAYEQQVTHIVHTGDLFHSKLQLTPECVALAVEFLRKLSDIAPVYMICGNHDCFSFDHEVLTKNNGWVNIADYVNTNSNEEVATFNKDTQTIDYQRPTNLIKKQFNGKLVNILGTKIDMLVTPTHQVLYNKNSYSKFLKKNAEEINIGDMVPLNGTFNQPTDDFYHKLLGFCFADATFVVRKHKSLNKDLYDGSRIQFHFKKTRKVQYLSYLLDNLNYKYNINYQKDGTVYIRIYGDLAKKIITLFNAEKQVPDAFLSFNKNEMRNFIDGYLNGDGSKTKENTWSCNTICHKSAVNIVTMARICGFNSHLSETVVYGKYKNSKRQYLFYINETDICNSASVKEINYVDYNDFVYCVSVPNENILVKRNDKIYITGNCTVRNTKRLDSITPIVDAINSDRIHYFKKSGEYNFGDVTFGAFSMLDPDNYPNVSDPNKLNIALYHGSISGVMTDSGYVISHGDCDVQIFKGYDYALLGDIHLSYQKVDDDGRCAYAGSTLQQNFGETDDKGVLIWDIKDKNTFECKHYAFKCPKPFITLELNNDGLFDEWRVIPQGARIRLQTYYNLSADRVKTAIEGVKSKWKPESVTFVSKALVNKENLENVSNLSRVMNLRDVEVQEELAPEKVAVEPPKAPVIVVAPVKAVVPVTKRLPLTV